jgi:hypothetical protein
VGFGSGFGGLFAGSGTAFAVAAADVSNIWHVAAGAALSLAGYWMFRFGAEVTDGRYDARISWPRWSNTLPFLRIPTK